jgi:subfamily B ATP-binding cassette protein HlyB/CyaB
MTVSNSLERLSKQPGFKSCLPDQLSLYASLFRSVSFSMGEPVLTSTSSPPELFFLIEGQLRLVVDHPVRQGRLLTLSLEDPGYLLGLSSLQCGLPLEYATAAIDSELLAISVVDWLHFISAIPSIGVHYNSLVPPVELWHLLSINQLFDDLVNSPRELRFRLRQLSQIVSCITVSPGSPSQASLPSDSVWLLSSFVPTLTVGSQISPNQLPVLQAEGSKPLRLVGFPQPVWSGLSVAQGITSSFLNSSSSQTPTSASVNSSIIPDACPSAPEDSLDISEPPTYKFFSSPPGSAPECLACFRMLGHQLNLPLKPDLLKRIIDDFASRNDGSIPLAFCASLAESLGLQTQLIGLPLPLLQRLETPALIHLSSGELIVAFEASAAALVAGRPRTSVEQLSVADLQHFVDSDGNLPTLLLRVTDRTPQRKFGVKWFLPILRKNQRQLIEVFVASLFVQLFQLGNPLITQQIVDKVIGQNGLDTLPVLAVLLIAFSIFENVLTAVRTNLFIETTNRIDMTLGEQVIDHLLRLPLNYFDRRPVGELSTRLGELENIRSFLTGTALTVLLDVIFSVIYIIMMLIYSWFLTLVALLLVPVLALITVGLAPVLRDQMRVRANLNAATQNHLLEVLTGIQTVKAQNIELNARWRWKERYSLYVKESFKTALMATTTNGFTQFLNQLSSLLVLAVGAWLVVKGELTLGQLIAFRIFSGYVTTPILRLSNLWQSFQQTGLSLERLSDIVDTPQESTDLDRINIPLPPVQGAITYEDISFRFGQTGPLQLTQLNFEIPSGEFVAIVGQSGSGKSTLTKLLPRLYPPLSGRILVDGYDISKVELYSLRRQIGIVPQESLLFEGSVQDNIALTNPDATAEDVIAAAKVACAHDFIMTLPTGYSSPVGERGGSLSGGQRQRIAIARTVLQNPRLLIMDEATSALDYETERRVSLNLMEHFRGRTVLFITHRLSSIRHADRIMLMHQGLLEEVGTHDELMAQRGRYYALWRQQDSGQPD